MRWWDEIIHAVILLAGFAGIILYPSQSTEAMVVMMVGALGLVNRQALQQMLSAADHLGLGKALASSGDSVGSLLAPSSDKSSPFSPPMSTGTSQG